jgi:uroporphyrinogen decarboxylase
MTHLERFNAAMQRKSFDRLPRFYAGTPEFSKSLEEYLGKDLSTIVQDDFDIDLRIQKGEDGNIEAKSWSPAYIGPEMETFPDGSFRNIWGSKQKKMYHKGGRGSYTETFEYALNGDLTVADIENHTWPEADWYDFSSIISTIEKYPDYPFIVGYWAIGWYSWEARGMEQCFMDFLLEPKVAEALTTKIADIGFEYYQKLLQAVEPYIGKNVVGMHTADDWGTQDGLIMHPDVFYKFYAPHYRRYADLAHSYGLLLEFHSCGAARDLYPGMIDVGVDIMNPVQTSAKGMIPHEIKAEFGKDLAFSGGVDVQQLLPNATVQEVKDEVKYLLDSMGRDGGYFPGPAHNIQLGTPPANVIAMYDAMDDYYGV